MIKKVKQTIKDIFDRCRYLENHKKVTDLKNKLYLQAITAGSFFILSIANIAVKSYIMLIFTALGCIINIVFALLTKKYRNSALCTYSSIATCTALFCFFVVYGGNDGFSCLWVVLMPLLAMVAMDFRVGLYSSVFFQIYLMVVFWTPLRYKLLYTYNEQFCLRFPLFFFVTFIIGLLLALSLQKSEYNNCMHVSKLEELSVQANIAARLDPLTKLANRRSAYEEFEKRFGANKKPHCIIMGDIDNFKSINDTYGHEFGDDVLVSIAQYMSELLPPDYLKSRWGGEEFLFAANVPISDAYNAIEYLRKTIAGHKFYNNGTPVQITITFGIAEYRSRNDIIKAISIADKRLYDGKKATKNCTVIKG